MIIVWLCEYTECNQNIPHKRLCEAGLGAVVLYRINSPQKKNKKKSVIMLTMVTVRWSFEGP